MPSGPDEGAFIDPKQAPDNPLESPDATPEEKDLLERKVETVRGKGFITWLRDKEIAESERYKKLADVILTATVRDKINAVTFRFEQLTEIIDNELEDQEERNERIKDLIVAESEWRLSTQQKQHTAMALGIKRVTDDVLPGEEALSASIPTTDLRCVFTGKAGQRCRQYAVPGSALCVKHGGTIIDPEVRRSYLLMNYSRIVEVASRAIDVLVDVAENGRNDLARVAASKELLDRAGLTPELNVNMQVGPNGMVHEAGSSAADQLASRLKVVSSRLQPDVIEGDEIEAS